MVGKKITMYFKFAGVVSTQEVEIIDFNDDNVEISSKWTSYKSGMEEHGIFSRKTGKCLNDNITFGAERYIDPIVQ